MNQINCPSGWQKVGLVDVVQLQRGHDLPTPQRRHGTVPILGSFGVTGYHDSARHIGPGVSIGRSGASIGTATYRAEAYWPLNTVLFVSDYRGNHPRWVFYLLSSIDFSGYNSGSAQPSLNRNYLVRIPVLLPPVAEQRGIASTLGALDDKIESNRRLIGTCSSLLDATSSSFAVDVESVPLSDLAEPMRHAFNPRSLGTELIDHFSIPAFDAKGLPDRATAASVISAKLRVDRPAVLVSRLNPKTNRTWFAVPESGVTAGCSTEFLVLAPKAGVTLGSLWLAVRDEGFRSLLAQRVTGTSGSHQRVKPLDALATEVPDVRQLPAADVHGADELLWFTHQRRVESTRLAALRDALLPELLSGRIRVPEAREAVDTCP